MKPETIEIKNNTNNTISVSVGSEEYEPESRGDFHDFDYEPDDISFLKTTAQIETLECLLEQILQELIQIRNKLN